MDDHHLAEHVRNYFISIFSEENQSNRQCLQYGHFPPLPDSDWNILNAPINMDEVRNALFDMAPCKAPGPDGFNACFFQKTWNIVGMCLFKFVKNFFETGRFPEGCNDTLISLIPKVPNPESVKQLRPIGLCNVIYKLTTKVMANRLRAASSKLIGMHQASFVPGRLISDNILVYQEVLHSMKSKKGSTCWMVVKVDLEKAYDRLSWNFIDDTLKDIGFNHKWRSNVRECISSSRLAVL